MFTRSPLWAFLGYLLGEGESSRLNLCLEGGHISVVKVDKQIKQLYDRKLEVIKIYDEIKQWKQIENEGVRGYSR